MSDSVPPHRQQPTRLSPPWDSPGKNTGVGCHFLLQCMKMKVKSLSCVQLLATPWTAAHQAPRSMGFSRQEYWSGLLFPSPGYLPDPGIRSESLVSPALAGGFFTTSATREAPWWLHVIANGFFRAKVKSDHLMRVNTLIARSQSRLSPVTFTM